MGYRKRKERGEQQKETQHYEQREEIRFGEIKKPEQVEKHT